MNFKKVNVLILCLSMFSFKVFAAEIVNGGVIHFRGEIVVGPKPLEEIKYNINKENEFQIFQEQRAKVFVKTLKNVLKFEILPYHTMGEFKWRELGWKYQLEGVKPPTKSRVHNAQALMDTESYQDYLERIK